MRTAEGVFSAAREIAKAQLPDGSYVPTSKLTAEQRGAQKHALMGGSYGHLRGSHPNAPAGRGLADVYDKAHAGPAMPLAMKEDLRASKVHPNVRFGSSIGPALEAAIDRQLKAELVGSAKKPVAFHYGSLNHGVVAAALSPHVTTGDLGRVVVSSNMISASGQLDMSLRFANLNLREVLNHEVAHTIKTGNPRNAVNYDGTIRQVRAYGEEARADARGVNGTGLYQRNGTVSPESALRAAERDPNITRLPKAEREMLRDAIAGQRSYPKVHAKVQEIYGTKDWEMPGDKPKSPRQQRKEFRDWIAADMPESESRATPSQRVLNSRIKGLGAGLRRNRFSVAGAIGGGVGAAYGYRKAQAKRDADGDGRINDGTPQERAVTKSLTQTGLDANWLFAKARNERDERIRDVSAAGAGLSAGAAVGTNTAQHRTLGRGDGPIWDRSTPKPSPEVLADWAKTAAKKKRLARAGKYSRGGLAVSAAGFAAGAGVGAYSSRQPKRDNAGRFAKSQSPSVLLRGR